MRRGIVLLLLTAGCVSEDAKPTIATAASLRVVMPAAAAAFGAEIAFTYGASGDLRKQVEGGAPIDAVLFASAAPVDSLIASGHADAATRRVLATNELVLIVPAGSAPLSFETLVSIPRGERIAIGDPGAVPAGQYARDTLQKLGVWKSLEDRLVLGGDVAAVLAYTRRGEVAAAIVYRTETRGIDDVTITDEARGDWAPNPQVVGALTGQSLATPRARAFLDFLQSPEGRRIFEEHGFRP